MNDAQPGSPTKRPPRWAVGNWPVRWKVVAIVVIPLVLSGIFGGLRIHDGWNRAADLRRAAERAELVPALDQYTAAIEGVLLANPAGGDLQQSLSRFDAAKQDLARRLASADTAPDVATGVKTLLDGGQALLDRLAANDIGVRDRVTTYAPLLLTAEDAVNGSVRVDDHDVSTEALGLSRAMGARGQMAMLALLVDSGGQLGEPELRTSMITLAGTEPSTLFGMTQALGVGSADARRLQDEMVKRMALMSDPAVALANNPELTQSIRATNDIATRLVDEASAAVTAGVDAQATRARGDAIRDSVIVGVALLVALLVVALVAAAVVRPLRRLRDGALRVAHEDLARELDAVRGGEPVAVRPLPVYTTEEIGQVAHAVDELHEQAVELAAEQTRLQTQLGDMFETLSRRSRSLVDQQLTLIDGLERDEQDPRRLEVLFRLDHLAARMRRNGANLLVLSGGRVSREQADAVPVAALVDAAASEVEDYRRVVTRALPDVEVAGTVAGDLVHVVAELLDNALRYSPPSTRVYVDAVRTDDGGLLVEIGDTGLGMTDSDLRVANARLQSGGEVDPYTARHMGLFVVGRLAAAHGLTVRLRHTVAGDRHSGTTVGVHVPVSALVGVTGPTGPERRDEPVRSWPEPAPARHDEFSEYVEDDRYPDRHAADHPADEHPAAAHPADEHPADEHPADEHPADEDADTGAIVTAIGLPQRNPGASGITPASATVAPAPDEPTRPTARERGDGGSIFDKMLSEWLIDDPHELANSSDLDWQTVWDKGWSAAEAAERTPVDTHTEEGLPVREPGARLVPGAAETDDAEHNGRHGGRDDHPAPTRDPEAVRASISSHFGGVRAGRDHARHAEENDPE